MRYLVKFSADSSPDADRLEDREGVYLSPEGDAVWAILDEEDEESLRSSLGAEAEEIRPLLPPGEYLAVRDARAELERAKGQFVDDPSGALTKARRSVGRALEARGYPPPERAEETSGTRREILQDYRRTDVEGSGAEDIQEAFGRLSGILERSARS